MKMMLLLLPICKQEKIAGPPLKVMDRRASAGDGGNSKRRLCSSVQDMNIKSDIFDFQS